MILFTHITLSVLATLFIASFVRSSFGFGEALVSVPLLSFFIPLDVAVPLATLVSITVASVVVLQDRRNIHFKSASILLVSTLFGIPLGLWLLTKTPPHIGKSVLAFFIMGFSFFCLFFRNRFELKNDKYAYLFGFCAGVSGGLYGMNGPPLAIYGSFRRWTPQNFRATLQGYFLLASSVGMFGYWATGLWVPDVTRYYLLSLPLVVAGVLLGRYVNQRMSVRTFVSLIHVALIAVALMLLYQSSIAFHS